MKHKLEENDRKWCAKLQGKDDDDEPEEAVSSEDTSPYTSPRNHKPIMVREEPEADAFFPYAAAMNAPIPQPMETEQNTSQPAFRDGRNSLFPRAWSNTQRHKPSAHRNPRNPFPNANRGDSPESPPEKPMPKIDAKGGYKILAEIQR
ncbi:uncharacterized protein PV07_02320 [Cladophialophora immunda]|uniref:Uncharacterized protein n=1 Tax=Cladophialophora immunda TaxID=569365 RepID=A0A0D2D091_9EURO|nr:uncharacterized protein PV07_02320 [Cladophialophora immunda]KIW35635.1 hypothetical protein PV07_02320 [Cladophialophora immunda]